MVEQGKFTMQVGPQIQLLRKLNERMPIDDTFPELPIVNGLQRLLCDLLAQKADLRRESFPQAKAGILQIVFSLSQPPKCFDPALLQP